MPWPHTDQKNLFRVCNVSFWPLQSCLEYVSILYLAIPFYGVEVIFLRLRFVHYCSQGVVIMKKLLIDAILKLIFLLLNGKKNTRSLNIRKRLVISFQFKKAGTKTQPSEITIGSKSGRKNNYIGQMVNEEDRKILFNLLKTL